MYGTQDASHIWPLDYVNLICGELGGFRRGKHSAALFHNPNQDVRMAVHGDDFVCLSDDDGLKHIDTLLKSKYTAERHRNTWTRRLGCGESFCVFRVRTDQARHFLDTEPVLTRTTRHQIIWMQREHPDSESTTREIARQVGV